MNFIKKHKYLIVFLIFTILALGIRLSMLNFQSLDYKEFLNPWLNFFRNNGGIKAIAEYKGDYNAPYVLILALLSYLPFKNLYLIKLISIIFDFLFALACGYLGYFLAKKKNIGLLVYIVILFLPQFVLNGAMWGQCDSIYAFFLIISLIYLLKEKYFWTFIFLGISFAFKLQAVFILPLYAIIYVTQRKFSFFYFLLVPLVEIVLCIPNIIFGMPFIKCFTIYFQQIGEYSNHLVLNYPNIYQIINFNYNILNKIGLLITWFICMLTLFYLFKKTIKWNKEKIINLGFLLIMLVTYFLPCMHERYVYFGEALAIVYYLVYRKNLGIVIMVNLNAIVTYIVFLFSLQTKIPHLLYPSIAIIYGILLFFFAKKSLNFLTNEVEK